MNDKHLLLFGIVSFLYFVIGCSPHICSDSVDYSFSIQAKAYPDRDSIHVGDTVWLEVNTPTTFTDNISVQPVDFSNAANFGTGISFTDFNNITLSIAEADELFDFISVVGTTTPPANQYERECSFKEIGNTYQFKIAIIPKQKGTFGLIVSSPNGIYRKNNVCSKAAFTFTFTDTNQHLYLSPYYDSTAIIPPNPDYNFKVY